MGDIGEGVLGAERSIGTVFDFEDGGWLEDLDGVPLVARDVDAVVAGGGVEEVALGGTARLIAEDDVHAAAQEDVGLGGGVMAVDGEDRAGEEDVDEALGFGIKDFPNAYNLYRNEITLPLYTRLTDEQVEYILTNFTEILRTL